jgi:hypothetical protein
MAGKSLGERLAAGPVICAEGYLFELEDNNREFARER